jgi:hypothetical protein
MYIVSPQLLLHTCIVIEFRALHIDILPQNTENAKCYPYDDGTTICAKIRDWIGDVGLEMIL